MARLVLLLCVAVGVWGEGGTWGEEGDGGAWGDQSSGGYTCSPCHNVECDVLHQCVAGVVPDRCGCCQVG